MDFRFFFNARFFNYFYNLALFGNKNVEWSIKYGRMTHKELEQIQESIQSFLLPWQSTIVATLDVRLVKLVRMSQVSTIVATIVRVELGPCVDQPPDPIEQELPDLYPSCATRTMTEKAKQNDGKQDIDLIGTFIGQSINHEISKSLSPSLSDMKTDLTHNPSVSDHYPSFSNDQVMTRCQCHSLAKNNTVILRSRLYLKWL